MESLFSFPLSIRYLSVLIAMWMILVLFFNLLRYVTSLKEKIPLQNLVIVLFSGMVFLTTGFSVGLLSSLSRAAVAEAMIPAVLTLVGGFLMYIVKKEEDVFSKILSFLAVFLLCVSLLYGNELGSYHRNQYENKQKDLEHWYQKDLELFKHELSQQSK